MRGGALGPSTGVLVGVVAKMSALWVLLRPPTLLIYLLVQQLVSLLGSRDFTHALSAHNLATISLEP